MKISQGLLIGLILVVAVALISCGGAKKDEGWSTFIYTIRGNDGPQSCKVKVKISESYYQLGESGEVELTVVYSIGNLSDAPMRFDWEDKFVQDFSKNVFEPYGGNESRTLNNGDVQDDIYVSYRMPPNVADGGGMSKLFWGNYDMDSEKFGYRIKLNPELRR